LFKKVYPGHLNYDAAVGTGGASDLPKTLTFTSMLYCLYSDYKSEQVDHNPAQDSTIHGISPTHGSAKKSNGRSATLVVGGSAKGISVLDQDYYVNPWSGTDKSHYGEEFLNPAWQSYLTRSRYKINAIGQGTWSAGPIPG